MATELTASQMTDQATDLIAGIAQTAINEARVEIAQHLTALTTPAEHANLAACSNDPENFEPTEEFLAGMRFAAELLADRHFDY